MKRLYGIALIALALGVANCSAGTDGDATPGPVASCEPMHDAEATAAPCSQCIVENADASIDGDPQTPTRISTGPSINDATSLRAFTRASDYASGKYSFVVFSVDAGEACIQFQTYLDGVRNSSNAVTAICHASGSSGFFGQASDQSFDELEVIVRSNRSGEAATVSIGEFCVDT